MIARENPSFTRHYKPSQTIVYPGDASDWLLQLESGLIRVSKLSPNGQMSTLRLVRPGDYFGEENLTDRVHENEAVALSETTVRSVNPTEMTASEQRAVSINLADQLGRSMEHSCHIRNRELRHRVAWYVLELLHSAVGGFDEKRGRFIRATHQLIAEGIGAARESVSNTIIVLAREGRLRSGYRQLVQINAQALENIVCSTSDMDGDGFYPIASASVLNPQTQAPEPTATSRYPNFNF
jgi:CRP/FNR family transcriptional regulator, LitR-dependent transcriptional activator